MAVTAKNMKLADAILEGAGVGPGIRLLDVAAGSGAVSIPAARRGAAVLATDILPPMIERFLERAREAGLSNLEGRVMDGQALDLEDEAFDIVASQFGVMLFPDIRRGLAEMARVTKRDGRVIVVAFGPPLTVEFIGTFLTAAKAAVPDFVGMPLDPPPLPFQLADPAIFRDRLVEAGLRDVQIETMNYAMEVASGKQLWDLIMSSNPIGPMMVAGMTSGQKTATRQRLDAIVESQAGDAGLMALGNRVHVGTGTR